VSAEPRRPWWAIGCAASTTAVDLANLRRFFVWTLGWLFAFGGVAAALRKGWLEANALGFGLALVPVLVGLGALHAYRRFLREADELQRRIQLDGIALGFGVGIVFSFGYRLFERLGAPKLDVSDLVLVMCVFSILGTWLASRRYS
jgi:hypothetical protein